MKITLNSKNEEIFKEIPPRFRDIIINSILTKNTINGNLLKELSFYVNSEEFENISGNLPSSDIEVKKKSSYYSKNKKQKIIKSEIKKALSEENESESMFIGFDD